MRTQIKEITESTSGISWEKFQHLINNDYLQ